MNIDDHCAHFESKMKVQF